MITIRAAQAADRDAVWPMLRDVFRAGETYAVDQSISKEDALTLWCDVPAATFVAGNADGICGTYYIKTNQAGGGAHVCNCGYIVSPAARGQGVAAQMCVDSQLQAQAMGYRAMQFNLVLASNAGAVRLWHKLGFETVGSIPDAFDHPKLGFVDAFVMYKRLTA
ncbi:MAG: GNAT family N-acetyltransferase [Pseudomonadota bacterium]